MTIPLSATGHNRIDQDSFPSDEKSVPSENRDGFPGQERHGIRFPGRGDARVRFARPHWIPSSVLLAPAFTFLLLAGPGQGREYDDPRDLMRLRVDYSVHADADPYPAPMSAGDGHYWWKGGLHTHTLWSDGDQFPEVVTQWYVAHGYHFLALSDHNVLSRGEKWINPRTYYYLRNSPYREIVRIYQERFGNWAEVREVDEALRDHLLTLDPTGGSFRARRPQDEDIEIGETVVRLRPLSEFRHLFERPERFLLIEATETTASGRQFIHINSTNIVERDPRRAGPTVEETIRVNMDAIVEQRRRYRQPMMAHLNHPNGRWAVRAGDMIPVENLRFFEVYGGHRRSGYHGDDLHVGLDRMWDIVLTKRLAVKRLGVVYGLAVDDAHHYENSISEVARPGRGWVVVRSPRLDPADLIVAMESGDFYASTGVTLKSIHVTDDALAIEIAAEEGVSYTTKFIGTRWGYDARSEPVRDADGNELNVTRRYSDDVGKVLETVEGTVARYEFSGDEIYVRARVISSKPHPSPHAEGDTEWAWVQPVVPARSDRAGGNMSR